MYDAIMKTLAGVRRWDSDRVDLLGHLFGVIRSDIWSNSHSLENKLTKENNDDLAEIAEMNGQYFSPEHYALARSMRIEIHSILIKQNIMYAAIFNEMLGDPHARPSEIAEALGCEVKTVYNARRKVKEVFELLNASNRGGS